MATCTLLPLALPNATSGQPQREGSLAASPSHASQKQRGSWAVKEGLHERWGELPPTSSPKLHQPAPQILTLLGDKGRRKGEKGIFSGFKKIIIISAEQQ